MILPLQKCRVPYPYRHLRSGGENSGFVNWATTMTPPPLPVASIRGGGATRKLGCIAEPRTCSSLRMAVAATGTVCACGNGSYSALPNQTGLRLRSATFLRGPASGTRWSIGCFSFITSNWRGEAVADYETIVRLIAAPPRPRDCESLAG